MMEESARERRDTADSMLSEFGRLKAIESVINRGPAVLFLWRIEKGIWPVELVSENVEDMLGYTADDFTSGRIPWISVAHPEDVQRLRRETALHLKRGTKEWSQQYRMIKKSGQVCWVHDWNQTIVDQNGRTTHIQAIVLDVTDRKNAEEALLEGEEKYREVVERANDGILILQDGVVKYANPRIAELAGCPLNRILGRDFTEFVHPGETRKVKENYLRRMAGKKVERVYETLLKRNDGSAVNAEINAGIITYHGRPADLVIVRDISERKLAEKELRESEARYRNLVENSLEGIGVSRGNRVIFANKALLEIFGYLSMEEFTRIPLLDHVAPDYRAMIRERMRRRERGLKAPLVYEYQLIRKDGEIRDVEISTSEVAIKGERCVQSTFRDITDRKRAENALRESEERYRGLVESQQDLIVRVDPAGRFTFVNDAYCVKFGKTREEMLGRTFMPLVHKDDLPATLKAMEGLKKPPYRIQVDQRALTAAGWRWISWEDYAIRNDRGKLAEIQAVGRDITDRKLVEDALRSSKEFSENLVETANAVIVLLDLDARIRLFNKFAEDLTGYGKKEVVGKSWFSMFIPRAQRQSTKQVFKNIIAQMPDVFSHENPILTKRGEERIIRWNNTVLKDDAGKVTGVLSIGIDVTGIRKTEVELMRVSGHLQTVLDGIDEAIVVIGKDYRVISHNKAFARSLRRARKRIVGERCYGVIHGFLTPCRKCVVRDMFRTGRPALDVHYHLEGGRKVFHEVKAYPIKGPSGNVTKSIYIFRDVSERETMYERVTEAKMRLEELSRMKSYFISIASHELKTPLAIIKGYVDVIRAGVLGGVNRKQKEKMDAISNNIKHLSRLIENILDLSRIEAGELKLSPRRTDLTALVSKVVEDFKAIAGERRIDLRFRSGNIPEVTSDQDRVKQVLINLLDNSLKFTPPGGRVTVRLRKNRGFVQLTVEDTGIGISKRGQERLFDSFYQVDATPTRRFKGFGLGLSICKKIVDLHGGRITIASKPGKGTRVWVLLPL